MNPLRELAEGWEYRTSEEGQLVICRCTCATEGMAYSVVKDKAAECFADAKPEEPVRKGERVVVVENPTFCGNPSPAEIPFAGLCGTVMRINIETARILFDVIGEKINISLINLRRERADEGPAEKKPEWKPALGQWVRSLVELANKGVMIGRPRGDSGYTIKLLVGPRAGATLVYGVRFLRPCAPVVTDAMKLLCWPGNRVRVIEHPAGDDGAPLSKGGVEKYSNARIGVRLLGRAGVVEGVGNMVGVVLDRHSDSEAAYEAAGRASRSPHPITGPHALIVRCWPWNLEPAEEK